MTETIPPVMHAVVTMGHGGHEMLEYRSDVAVPQPTAEQVLIRIAAAGINNTDLNTRTGWYSKSITFGADGDAVGASAIDGSWGGRALEFPLIQGADACGHIVAVGEDVDQARIGERVIVATMQRLPYGDLPFVTGTLGSEWDGAFAEYMVAHAGETHSVDCDWTDAELASIPCAWSTAENMLHRIDVTAGERVLITGASGGVGSAAVQLVKRRAATVVAVVGASKADRIAAVGADRVVHRGADLVDALGSESIDVVVDLVGGDEWPQLLDVLRRGGRYISSGAIAGPMVDLDLRTLYLNDLTLKGATYQEAGVFENLVGYIERGEIRPLVHATYPLADIVKAQEDFTAKDFVGKLVLIP